MPRKPVKKTKVYAVTLGEAHEGGRICGIFWSLRSARRIAIKTKQNWFSPNDWVETEPNHWRNGCDILEIEEWNVKN